MNDTVFTDDNTDTNINDGETDSGTFLDQLVGEGKKFKSAEDLARGKAEADRYVEQLRTELENQRKLNEEKFERLLNEVKTNKSTQTATGDNSSQPSANQDNSNSRPQDASNTRSDDAVGDVESLVKKALREHQDLTKKEANLQVVDQRLTEMFGEKAKSVVRERAQELEVSVDSLKEMASTSPKAFMKLIAGEEGTKGTNFSSAQPRVNSESLGANRSNTEQGWSYYRELKAKNPNEFWKRHQEIHEKVKKMGADKFYNS